LDRAPGRWFLVSVLHREQWTGANPGDRIANAQ
jgi:hypothetical protein